MKIKRFNKVLTPVFFTICLSVFVTFPNISLGQNNSSEDESSEQPAGKSINGGSNGSNKKNRKRYKRSEKKERRTKSGKRIVDRDSQLVYSDSSEANREPLKVTLLIQGVFFGSGYSAGYFLNPNEMVEVNYQSIDLLSVYKAKIYTANYTRFIGNSFNVSCGIGYREVEYSTFANLGSGSTFDSRRSATVTDFGIDCGIGNRWQWENFTLGAEWIGIFYSVGEKTITSDDENSSVDTYGLGQSLGDSRALTLEIGISF